MKLSAPTVGPIIGYTTPTQSRMLIRGAPERAGNEMRRCFGVVRWKPTARKSWSDPLFNKLSPNFDMTGVLVLDDLSPDTEYEYQAGWFFADAELEKIQELTEKQVEWPEETTRFKTATANRQAARAYVVGSC